MVFPKQRMSAFRLEDELMDAMDVIRERHGTPYSEMIRRALRMWLDAQGVPVKPATKRGKTRRAK